MIITIIKLLESELITLLIISNVYNINNVPIAVSVCERILGVYIDSSLSFSEHVINIVKKARVTCNLIFNAFHFCYNQVLIYSKFMFVLN